MQAPALTSHHEPWTGPFYNLLTSPTPGRGLSLFSRWGTTTHSSLRCPPFTDCDVNGGSGALRVVATHSLGVCVGGGGGMKITPWGLRPRNSIRG